MPIDALIDAIDRDTRARVAQIAADAVTRAEALRTEARRAEAAARDAFTADLARAHASRVEASLGEVAQEARHRQLSARARLLDRVRRAAAATAAEADATPAWSVWLPVLLDHARRAAGDGALVVRCRPALAAAVRAAGVEVRPDLDRAGLSIEAPGLNVDATLHTWLDQAFPRLARRVLDAVAAP